MVDYKRFLDRLESAQDAWKPTDIINVLNSPIFYEILIYMTEKYLEEKEAQDEQG